MSYCATLILIFSDNYLITLTNIIKIKFKYSPTSGIESFYCLIIGVFKMAKEKYIKMLTFKRVSNCHY